jgi:hypothetical protein
MLNKNLLINNGWYSSGTRAALEGAIIKYKPKIIAELGVYLAKSSCAIMQCGDYCDLSIDYYGFDLFTHCCNNNTAITFSPIDKLFLNYPKLDTSISNLAQYSNRHNINLVLYDVEKSVEYFKNKNIVPDLVYIDAIKDPVKLTKLIDKYLEYNPNIVIVGDDLENREKLYISILKYNPVIFNNQAYIINNITYNIEKYPKPISNNTYPRLKFNPNEIKNEYKTYLNAC